MSIAKAHETAFQSQLGNELQMTAWRQCFDLLYLQCWGSGGFREKRFYGPKSVL